MSDNQNNIQNENDEGIMPSDNTNENINADTASEVLGDESQPTVELDTSNTQFEPESAESGEPSQSAEEYAFQWNYDNIQEAPPSQRPRRKRTGLIFGIIASGVFVLAIIALVITILIGSKNGNFSLKYVVDRIKINVSDNNAAVDGSNDASSEDIEKFKNSTVVVLSDSGTGTGIILSDNGMIVTNHHVIENSKAINVYLYDGRSYPATLIGSDAYNDIAVIRINATDLSPATFANSDSTYTGQKVYAVGTPAGPEFAWSVTAGIVSSPSRELKFYNKNNELERSLFLIQTDALVNPGNSGGPLVNTDCEVMGIVTMRLSDDYVGMGFAIPTNVALPIIEDIITNYKEPSKLPAAASPQLGISGIVVEKGELFMMSDMGFKDIVTEDYYNRNPDRCNKASHAGIYVLATTEGFDAATKLKVGDIIIGVDKTLVTSMEDLKGVISSKRVGDTMNVTVIRDNQPLQITVTLGKAVQ